MWFYWIWLADTGVDYVTECKRHGLSVSHTCEVPLDERGSSVGFQRIRMFPDMTCSTQPDWEQCVAMQHS